MRKLVPSQGNKHEISYDKIMRDMMENKENYRQIKREDAAVAVMVTIGLLFITMLLSGCLQKNQDNISEICTLNSTGEKMNLAEAWQIASNSECIKQGNLEQEHWCNEVTGTWWIKLNIIHEGCSPACVVHVDSRYAEINWMCTGLKN